MRGRGEVGAQGKRQKAQSFYDEFSPKVQAKKKKPPPKKTKEKKRRNKTERRIRKNLKAADKSQIKYFNGFFFFFVSKRI